MTKLPFERTSKLKKGAFLTVPFLLFFAAVVLLSLWFSDFLVARSAYRGYFELLFSGGSTAQQQLSNTDPFLVESPVFEGDVLEGTFPMPSYGKQWATLNIDGWKVRDIPVFYGDDASILHRGAGQWQSSRFSGQNGKVVLSAHVTRHFYEIEDSAARFNNGEEVLVTMDALWGSYVYRVSKVVIFQHTDITPLYSENGKETLFLYTCYPRENGYSFKTERIGLYCELVSGATWRDYVG